jgi:hypothetical protein
MMIIVKYFYIKNPLVNKTYSKVSIWMLFASMVSITLATIKLWTEEHTSEGSEIKYINIVSGTIQAMFDTSNTLLQSYEWFTMTIIVDEQRGECMEWIMKEMQNDKYKD